MTIPLFLAHGQEIFALIFYVGVGAIVVSVVALVAAWRKKKEVISRLGVFCASLGILAGGLLAAWHGMPPPFHGVFSAAMLAPLPIGIVALVLCLKRKKQDD